MLRRLTIKNLALFKDIEVEFGPGLNVISGESGAGKTMLLKAIEIVLGGPVDTALIGPYGEEAYIEAAFDDTIPASLTDLIDPDQELTLARRLRRQGTTRALAGGRSCSAAQLAEAGHELLSMTGQHAAQLLVSTSYQRQLLDDSGNLEDQARQLNKLFKSWQELVAEMEAFREKLLDSRRKMEILRADIEAYDQVEPAPDELEQLEQLQRRLSASDQIREALQRTYGLLNEDGGAADRLGQAVGEMTSVVDRDIGLDKLGAELEELEERIREAGRQVRESLDSVAADPAQITEVEERLIALKDLQRRFRGMSFEDIRSRVATARDELTQIENGDDQLRLLEEKSKAAEETYLTAAKALSKERKKASKKLIAATEKQLGDLGMGEAELVIEMASQQPRANGVDKIRFLLKANHSLPPAPLDKGASGGELSRVNLALLLAAYQSGRSYIFDEVDSGIGGRTAHAVADRLGKLAENSQLIVITHLAQIAIRADSSFLISKDTRGEKVVATLQRLADDKERTAEIARLVGAEESDAEEATRMLQTAGKI